MPLDREPPIRRPPPAPTAASQREEEETEDDSIARLVQANENIDILNLEQEEHEEEGEEEEEDDEHLHHHSHSHHHPVIRYEVTAVETSHQLLDIQGIDWKLQKTTRARFRETRFQNYRTYQNLNVPAAAISQTRINPLTIGGVYASASGGCFYDFRYSALRTKPFVHHFQLRNLVWAPSKTSVYYHSYNGVRHYTPFTRSQTTPAIDLQIHRNMGPIKISTIAAKHDFLIVGGYGGEFAARSLLSSNDQQPVHTGYITRVNNGITNHMNIEDTRGGGKIAIISSNDLKIRLMDINRLNFFKTMAFDWAVNCSALSPDKRLLCVVGDSKDTLIVNSGSGETVCKLTGHLDYSFACAWSPCGRMIATGNQDMTTRLYDARNLSTPVATFGAKLGAVRSLKFSEDAEFLAIAESADFVHIVDLRKWEAQAVRSRRRHDGDGGGGHHHQQQRRKGRRNTSDFRHDQSSSLPSSALSPSSASHHRYQPHHHHSNLGGGATSSFSYSPSLFQHGDAMSVSPSSPHSFSFTTNPFLSSPSFSSRLLHYNHPHQQQQQQPSRSSLLTSEILRAAASLVTGTLDNNNNNNNNIEYNNATASATGAILATFPPVVVAERPDSDDLIEDEESRWMQRGLMWDQVMETRRFIQQQQHRLMTGADSQTIPIASSASASSTMQTASSSLSVMPGSYNSNNPHPSRILSPSSSSSSSSHSSSTSSSNAEFFMDCISEPEVLPIASSPSLPRQQQLPIASYSSHRDPTIISHRQQDYMDDNDEDEDDEGGGGDDEEGGENGGDNYYENYYGNGVDVDDEQPVGYASQTIDFFGEISGVAFGGSDSLYIGNADETYGALFEFERNRRHLGMFDAIFL